jgi:hypothetical protein
MLSALVTALCLAASGWAGAAPIGRFKVEGINPGGSSTYQGTVRVRKTGDTYDVQWTLGNRQYIGVGILSHGVFSVAYTSAEGSWLGVVA